MKSSVAVVLIICGTFLIVVPYITNAIAMQQVSNAMTALEKSVDLKADLPKYADPLCMIGGIIMIALGVFAGLCQRKTQ